MLDRRGPHGEQERDAAPQLVSISRLKPSAKSPEPPRKQSRAYTSSVGQGDSKAGVPVHRWARLRDTVRRWPRRRHEQDTQSVQFLPRAFDPSRSQNNLLLSPVCRVV